MKLKFIPWIFKIVLNFVDNQMRNSIKMQIETEVLPPKPTRAFHSYVLVDASKLQKLLKNKSQFSLNPSEPGLADFQLFKTSVFYIGKGTKNRKLNHLVKAKKVFVGSKILGNNDKNLSKIVSLWKRKQGVIILQLDCAATEYEAFSREFAMINAVSISKLMNIKHSTCYGEMRYWPETKVKNYGDMLLFQLFNIFVSRPPTPIYASDVLLKMKFNNKIFTQIFCPYCKAYRKRLSHRL